MLSLLFAGACTPWRTTPASAPAPGTGQLLAPGVSLQLARHRAATLSDVAYAIDLDVTEHDRAGGGVRIGVTRAGTAGDLILDFRGSAVHEVSANGVALEHVAWDGHHILVPARYLVAGRNDIAVRFTARVAPAGTAIIRYDDAQDGTRYLYTLLVPSDAQLLFPVLDQPDIKARFTWRITVPGDWDVLANGRQTNRVVLPAGRARVEFAETRPISTYVAAFAAGPWTILPARSASVSRPIGAALNGDSADVAGGMTLWTRRTRAAEVDADTLLQLNRDALGWLERYFGISYPFAKLDVLLAPAFPFSGMEHVGAIFYNETTFIFREPPTPSRRLARAATIYHEVAHQWFGNHVTMQWFDDLWLKEGFSTFMAAKIQQDLEPASEAWKTFYLRNKPAAYAVDASTGTTPVWQELENLDLAKSNYGAIVYNKAPSVLKQLEFMVGEHAFREGVRTFLRRHAYGNATWRDLLAAVGEAAGTDLGPFGRQYILRPGLPVVETHLGGDGAGRIASLALSQRPATNLPGYRGGWWPGRVRVRLGYANREDIVLDVAFTGERTDVPAARGLPLPDYVFANDGDYGYGLFLPDVVSAAWLLQHAGGIEDGLLRAMAWGSLWDLVREAQLPPALFAHAALRAFREEHDEQISAALLARISHATERYIVPGPARAQLAAAFEDALLARIDNPTLEYGLRRGSLDALLAGARSGRATQALRDFLAGRRMFDERPLPQPSRWAAITRLLAVADTQAAALFRAEQARDSTPEAARMAFIAGAAVADAAAKRAHFERYLGDEALNEEWVTASLAAFNTPRHAELSLPFLEPAMERAEWIRDNRRIFFLPRWLDAFIGGHASPEALAIVDRHLERNPDMPADVRRRILQARDELARAVRIRSAFPGLD
ncbi:MAG TPA: M1 family aminopeptidase [Longimicrobiales bacterium]|nr:M1 family aminopeptidase [Longimicrobiales bacterium]